MMRLLLFKLLDSLYYKHRLNLSLLVDIIFLFSLIATFIECYSKLSFLKKNSVCIFSLFIFISFKGVPFFPYYPALTTSSQFGDLFSRIFMTLFSIGLLFLFCKVSYADIQLNYHINICAILYKLGVIFF